MKATLIPHIDYDDVGELALCVEEESIGRVRVTTFEYKEGFVAVFHDAQDSSERVAKFAQRLSPTRAAKRNGLPTSGPTTIRWK